MGKVDKKVMKYKTARKQNLYVSSGQSSKSFLVGLHHGQGNGSKEKLIQLNFM